jgi:hypothetical protein
VQEQRDVVLDARVECPLLLDEPSVDSEPGRQLLGAEDVHNRDFLTSRLPGRLHLAGGREQETGFQVAQVEGVLVGRVGRVKRRCGCSQRRHGEQDLDELGPVRKGDGDPIAALDSDRAESTCELKHRSLERREGDHLSVFGRDEGDALLLDIAREQG